MENDMSVEICDMCENDAITKCGDCHFAVYCSEKCQAKDWPSHEEICYYGHSEEDEYLVGEDIGALFRRMRRTGLTRKDRKYNRKLKRRYRRRARKKKAKELYKKTKEKGKVALGKLKNRKKGKIPKGTGKVAAAGAAGVVVAKTFM